MKSEGKLKWKKREKFYSVDFMNAKKKMPKKILQAANLQKF